jgi:hypothetical protein
MTAAEQLLDSPFRSALLRFRMEYADGNACD